MPPDNTEPPDPSRPGTAYAHAGAQSRTTATFMHQRKEFLRTTMSTDEPEITTVTSKGQITIPSRFREEFDIERGTKLLVVPTDYGLVLKKVELPSIEEFNERVAARAEEVDLSLDDVVELVHDAREE